METRSTDLLTINTGSSSLKAAVYRIAAREKRLLSADARRIGLDRGQLGIADADGKTLFKQDEPLADHGAALKRILGWLADNGRLQSLVGVGHRVVHGGLEYQSPQLVDAALVAGLKALVPLAPDHLPQSIDAIESISRLLPRVPQVACFDTAFHRTLPDRARTLALPRAFKEQGVVRFGFHGLSYEYLVEQLRATDPVHAGGRAVLAHLGNGASMAAVQGGESRDTSMGFTPAGGLVMGTRTGDLDPGVLVYLLQTQGLSPTALNQLVNKQSGLLGISASSPDMRVLLDARGSDPRAAEAVEIFCYQARKCLGAYAAALGGLDTVVFAGGIGENSPDVRQQICAELDFLGVRLDPSRNRRQAAVISADDSRVTVRVIKTDEDLMIARHTNRLLAKQEK